MLSGFASSPGRIDAETGERHPIWAELDSYASIRRETALLIRAATNFEPGRRYIVAMRNMKNAAGETLRAPAGFRYYRDNLRAGEAAINRQRPRFNRIFRELRGAGINRADLYLAWDFTVSSDDNRAERMLHMRDEAFAQLGELRDRRGPDITPGQGRRSWVPIPPPLLLISGHETPPRRLTSGSGPTVR